MQSYYSNMPYLRLFTIIGLPVGFSIWVAETYNSPGNAIIHEGLPVIMGIIFILCCWLYIDLQTRATILVITDTGITLKKFISFDKPAAYDFSSLDSFETVNKTYSKGRYYQVLYFWKNNRHIGEISSLYHSNYNELKTEIAEKLQRLIY